MNELLPIADGPELRAQARRLGRRHRRGARWHGRPARGRGDRRPRRPAAARHARPVGPGRHDHRARRQARRPPRRLPRRRDDPDLVRARGASFVLSEKMFAELREDFMRRVLALPLSTVERAGTGDLVSRTTADVDALARTVRFAVPETLIAAITTVLTVAAAVWVSPLAALPCIVGVPVLFVSTRWYLKRAPPGYLWERASYATARGHRQRDRRRRADGRGAEPPRAARRADRRRPRQRLQRRDAHASSCARSGSRRPSSRTCSRSRPRSPGAATSSRRATPRSAR